MADVQLVVVKINLIPGHQQ